MGFNIAHSKVDHDKMNYYASFITKVQKEMGIEVTKFDPEILNEADEDEGNEDEGYSQREIEEVDKTHDEANYDDILGEAQTKLKSDYIFCPGPRTDL